MLTFLLKIVQVWSRTNTRNESEYPLHVFVSLHLTSPRQSQYARASTQVLEVLSFIAAAAKAAASPCAIPLISRKVAVGHYQSTRVARWGLEAPPPLLRFGSADTSDMNIAAPVHGATLTVTVAVSQHNTVSLTSKLVRGGKKWQLANLSRGPFHYLTRPRVGWGQGSVSVINKYKSTNKTLLFQTCFRGRETCMKTYKHNAWN